MLTGVSVSVTAGQCAEWRLHVMLMGLCDGTEAQRGNPGSEQARVSEAEGGETGPGPLALLQPV